MTPEREELIRRTVCPAGITADELALFLEQCRRTGLDPLLGEAVCVPRKTNVGEKNAPRWVTRHVFQATEVGMLVRAEAFPDFRGVQAAAVYADDECVMDRAAGEVSHRSSPTHRKGALLGAWARVERAGRRPTLVWVEYSAVAQSSPMWAKMPANMVEKSARVAALRKAYPAAFREQEEAPAEPAPAPLALPATTAPAAPTLGGRAVQVVEVVARPRTREVARMEAEELAQEEQRLQAWLAAHPKHPRTAEGLARLQEVRDALERAARLVA